LEADFDGMGKVVLKMKTTLFCPLLLLAAAMAPGALAAADEGEMNSQKVGCAGWI
jgi:hypothetical protein